MLHIIYTYSICITALHESKLNGETKQKIEEISSSRFVQVFLEHADSVHCVKELDVNFFGQIIKKKGLLRLKHG